LFSTPLSHCYLIFFLITNYFDFTSSWSCHKKTLTWLEFDHCICLEDVDLKITRVKTKICIIIGMKIKICTKLANLNFSHCKKYSSILPL
jgi:hypothetical protein